MKIFNILKGFVTNSSAANYWLNDGVLEPGEVKPTDEVRIDKAREEYYAQKAKTEQAKAWENIFSDLLLWAMFSLVLVIAFLVKKLKNNNKHDHR